MLGLCTLWVPCSFCVLQPESTRDPCWLAILFHIQERFFFSVSLVPWCKLSCSQNSCEVLQTMRLRLHCSWDRTYHTWLLLNTLGNDLKPWARRCRLRIRDMSVLMQTFCRTQGGDLPFDFFRLWKDNLYSWRRISRSFRCAQLVLQLATQGWKFDLYSNF